MVRYLVLAGIALAVAAPAAAEPKGDISPMQLPNGGGYLQPGNPNRGISSVSGDTPLNTRADKNCTSKRDRRCKAPAKRQQAERRR